MGSRKQPVADTLRVSYQRPAIVHKGVLVQFAGSPLGRPGFNPLNLPKK